MMLAVRRPRRRPGAVDDVVVEQGGGMDELDRGGELVVPHSGIIEQPRAGQGQHRPHALAAAGDEMAGELGDQGHLALHPLEDDGVDMVEVGRDQLEHRVERRRAAGADGVKACGHLRARCARLSGQRQEGPAGPLILEFCRALRQRPE